MNIDQLSGLELRKAWAEAAGRRLDAFAIYSASGHRLRERDFSSVAEAQEYIDREDERLTESHKSVAHGVNIRPCDRSLPRIESDIAVAMGEATRFCRENGLEMTIGLYSDMESDCAVYRMIKSIGRANQIQHSDGTTPAESIARCLTKALLALKERRK